MYMSSQIFRSTVPPEILYNLLDEICLKTEQYYVIDYNAYRKMLFYELHHSFLENLKEYYHASKQFYATRELTYKSFTNIIRHICNNANIMFSSKMKYNESKYVIYYYIFRQTE